MPECLWLAVLGECECVPGKPVDRIALRVGDHNVDYDQVAVGSDRRDARIPLLLGTIRHIGRRCGRRRRWRRLGPSVHQHRKTGHAKRDCHQGPEPTKLEGTDQWNSPQYTVKDTLQLDAQNEPLVSTSSLRITPPLPRRRFAALL